MSTSKGYDAGKMKFVNKTNDTFEFIGRTKDNYGVQGFVEKLNTQPNDAETISVSQVGAVHAQIRKNKWYSSQNIFVLTPNCKKLINLLVVTAIDKTLINYGGYSYPTLQMLKEHVIELPTKNDRIDFEFMDTFIQELELERIQKLETFLIATGLNDYYLSKQESDLLSHLPKFKSFTLASSYFMRKKLVKVDDKGLFNIVPTKKKINANDIIFGGQYPYVARGERDNGIKGYIDFNEEYLNAKNTISFGQDTATMYFQPNEYFTGDKIQVFTLNERYGSLDENIALYLISSLNKTFASFNWGQQSFALDVIAPLSVKLPITETGEIDFEYMKKYITIIKKITIEDVIKYKDDIISTSKTVID